MASRGSITRRQGKKGTTYRVRIVNGYDLDGKPIVLSQSFARRKDADDWRTKTLNALREGSYVEPSPDLTAVWLDRWLAVQRQTDLKASSLSRYESYIRVHLRPSFGVVPLAKLTPALVQDYALDLAERLASAGQILTVFHAVLDFAVRQGAIPRNPFDRVERPRRPRAGRERVRVWTAAQLATFLDGTRGERAWPAWWLAAHTGLRPGEVVALRWDDIDLAARTVRVRDTQQIVGGTRVIGDAKTSTSRRTVGIDDATVRVLRDHWQRQQEERRQIGDAWQDEGLVFPRLDGTAANAHSLSQKLARRAVALGLPRRTMHELRHTHCALLLEAGRPIHYVSRRLGHANIQTTLNLYAHLIPGTEHSDAEAFAALMDEARSRVS